MRSPYQFKWFEPEDARKNLRVSISKDGKLRLGQPLRSILPPDISIGFDTRSKVLAIADGRGHGARWSKGGVVTARRLSRQISSLGLKLPIVFQVESDDPNGYFLGRIVPRRKKAARGQTGEFDWDQVVILYQHILDDAARQLAKTTPLSERKALVREALVMALQRYRPGYGELEAYLESQIRATLIQENKFYTSSYRHRSLDQPLSASGENSFCLYDTLEAATDGGLAAAEERVMAEQFWAHLSVKEQRLTQMLQDGAQLPQIASRLNMTEAQLTKMAQGIAQKRKDFYAV